MSDVPKNPPLPDCPEGANPFVWILRTAPRVRDARREIAEQRRKELNYDRKEAARPAER